MIDFDTEYVDFMSQVIQLMCPICSERITDDGHDSNYVYKDQDGNLYIYYRGALLYPHNTCWCSNHHGFTVEGHMLGKHLSIYDEELEI